MDPATAPGRSAPPGTTRLSRTLTTTLVAVWAIAAAATLAALVVPNEGSAPGSLTLLAAGLLVTAVTAVALAFGLWSSLRLPVKAVIYALGYNGLIAIVKFTLAPQALYAANRSSPFTDVLWSEPQLGVPLSAVFFFVLYAAVYALIYRHYRKKVRAALDVSRPPRRLAVVVAVAAAVFVAGAVVLAALILPALAGLFYLRWVFSSGVSLLIAAALVLAVALATRVFASAADRAVLVRDVTVLTSFFWLSLALLALYHLLWVVYLLVLVTVWPLRVVTPK
ncbi:MAG: hypothetical protein GEV03_11605 [Streptosporangiales bacterium]|nr:hypothetical protein [Streptosporangiales bacterium]